MRTTAIILLALAALSCEQWMGSHLQAGHSAGRATQSTTDLSSSSSPAGIDSVLDAAERFSLRVQAALMSGDSSFLRQIPCTLLHGFADLDGCGNQDTITVLLFRRFVHNLSDNDPQDPCWSDIVLKVNTSSFRDEGTDIIPIFQVVDIDDSDRFREVAITELGFSDDEETKYYFFDGASVHQVGSIEGANYQYGFTQVGSAVRTDYFPPSNRRDLETFARITYPGNGALHTLKRGSILHTWHYPATYHLTVDHTLQFVPQPLYQMNTKVTMLHSLRLAKSRDDTTTAVTLEPGDHAIIVASDNIRWCLVRSSTGQEGWFAVRGLIIEGIGLEPTQVFDGLCIAD